MYVRFVLASLYGNLGLLKIAILSRTEPSTWTIYRLTLASVNPETVGNLVVGSCEQPLLSSYTAELVSEFNRLMHQYNASNLFYSALSTSIDETRAVPAHELRAGSVPAAVKQCCSPRVDLN